MSRRCSVGVGGVVAAQATSSQATASAEGASVGAENETNQTVPASFKRQVPLSFGPEGMDTKEVSKRHGVGDTTGRVHHAGTKGSRRHSAGKCSRGGGGA